ncbi:glycosyltransferase [Alphaproteobacteria bacterium]|nr:glycosyltransferase [Alphaproteobacteria bacterium]
MSQKQSVSGGTNVISNFLNIVIIVGLEKFISLMLKILHAISKGEAGGAQSSLVSYILALSSHINKILVGDDNEYLQKNAQKSNASDIKHYSILSNPIRRDFFYQILKIRRNITQEDYDLIFTHSLIASLIIRISLMATKKKSQYVVHGYTGNKNVPLIKRYVGQFLEFVTSCKVDTIIALSEKEKNLIRKIYKRNSIHVIPNTSYILETVEYGDLKKSAKRQIVCLSRFAKPKLNSLIVDAFVNSELNNARDWELIFYGDGPDLEASINRSKDALNIKFFSPVAAVKPILNQAEFLILMSAHEGLPMTMIEAFASGTKVICSDIEELREFERYDMRYDVVENRIECLIQKFNQLKKSERLSNDPIQNIENFNKYLSPDKFKERIDCFLSKI